MGPPHGPLVFQKQQGIINAVELHNPGSSPLFDDLLVACESLLGEGCESPSHLHSHWHFLDAMLDKADVVAKRKALEATMTLRTTELVVN